MRTIYKYEIQVTDSQVIQLPAGAEILTVQTQREAPQLWVIVDVSPQGPAEREDRHIAVYGTGHTMRHGDHKYIGTFQMHGGVLVFHVFELL